jgi:hypothetical protein
MKRWLYLSCVPVIALVWSSGCGTDGESTPTGGGGSAGTPEAGAGGSGGTLGTGGHADAGGVAGNGGSIVDGGSAGTGGSAGASGSAGSGGAGASGACSPDCQLVVSLSETSGGVAPSGVSVPSGSNPVICWSVPQDGALPGPDGWDVWVGRDDAPSGEPTDAEWMVMRGVPRTDCRVVYGDCPTQAMACFGPNPLQPGAHTVAVWDGTTVGGLAGVIAFDVQ